MKLRSLLTVLSLMVIIKANSQIIKSKLDIVAGLSAREYAHVGLKYQYSEITQLGLYFGNDLEFRQSETINTFCVDNQIHFGKLSFYSNRPVWYARQGYTFSKNQEGDNIILKYSYLDISFGREFAFNDRLGVNADLGMLWQFRKYTENLDYPLETPYDTRWYLMPLARIQLFLSL